MLRRVLSTGLLTIGVFTMAFQVAFAQFSVSDIGNYQPELVVSPSTPEPGKTVSIEIGNYLSSLYGSTIDWYIDGALQPNLANRTQIEAKVGSLGTQTRIQASMTTPAGQVIRTETTITPQYLDIIIEPQTYVPSFYTGRPLPSTGSQVNVTAILNGRTQSDLTYAWRINGDLLGGAVARGQYATHFTMPQDSRVILELRVSEGRREVARKSILIPNVRPFLQFYESHTLYGISTNAYDSVFLTGGSVTLIAAPYYLDTRVFNNPDVANWELNGRPAASGNNPYRITLERSGLAGNTTISFQVQSTTALLQGARSSIPVLY